jgi:predicted ATPase
VSRSAIFEAAAHFGHGLEDLVKLPDDRRRQQTELELRLALAGALATTKGSTALEVLGEYERARELAEKIDDQGRLIHAMHGIWANQFIGDNVSLAVPTAQQLLKLAEACHDITGRWIGHRCIAMSSFQAGALSTATEHFQKALALDNLEQARILCQSTAGQDLGVNILNVFSRALAVLGLPQQARSRRDELLVRGSALGHTPSHAISCLGAFITSVLIRDTAGQASAVETLLRIVAEDRFAFPLAHSTIYSGWLKIEAGNLEQGCRMISEGISACDARGFILGRYFYLALLANGQLRSGKVDDGLDTLDRAESLIRKTGSRWCEAEIYRLRGDLQLARSTKPEAETSYLQALELARLQDAKLWEIRTATSLGRLWRDQGKGHEARDLLAPVYNWFTRGI